MDPEIMIIKMATEIRGNWYRNYLDCIKMI